jgi:hypothetical protein
MLLALGFLAGGCGDNKPSGGKSDETTGGEAIRVAGVFLSPSELTLKVGESRTLVATVVPSEATNQALVWESSNPNVAEVDQNGHVTTTQVRGTASIVVRTRDGNKTAACALRVVAREEPMPDIIGFVPGRAAHGATVEIFGNNFSAKLSENVVTLNGIAAEVVSVSTKANKLDIVVPKNIHCAGPLKVNVNGKTATADTEFVYVPTVTVSTLAGSSTAGYTNATGGGARFSGPWGLAVGTDGNIYVGDYYNHHIRKVTPGGAVTSLAGGFTPPDEDGWGGGNPTWGYEDGNGEDAFFYMPSGLTTSVDGFLYVADFYSNRIRRVSLAGDVTTLASIQAPIGVVAAAGDFYVLTGHRIQKVSLAGDITPFVGSETAGFLDATGATAQFRVLQAVAADASRNL